MLLYIFQWLSEDIRFFSVFNYLSLRAVLAALTAMAIGFAAGPAVIARLRAMKIGQAVRGYGPKSHLVKDGTPTMGGALILVAIGISTLLWMDLSNRFVWVVLFVTLGYGAIGWTDDYRKVVHHNPEGMSAREKFAWQSVIGLIAAVYLAFTLSMPEEAGVWSAIWAWIKSGFTFSSPGKLWLTVPFFKQIAFPFGVFGFVIFTYIVIVGTSNAVNLTDGLDGLAAGVSSIAALCIMVLCILTGEETAILLTAALAGSCLGFLPRNFNPAQIFMGDTGATFLGYTLAVSSILGVFKGYAILALVVSMLCLGLPIFDTMFAMVRRMAKKQPIMQADRGHLHHRLIDRGFSQKQAVMILYGISIFCGLMAILIMFKNAQTAVVIILTIFVLSLLIYFFNNRRKIKHQDDEH